MAIYHLRAQIITRGTGRSVVAAAAYRHRTVMHDRRQGTDFKFRADQHLIHSEMALPSKSPAWVRHLSNDPGLASEELWNKVEESEPRIDGQLAREFVVAFPKELSAEQNIELMRDYVKSAFTDRGMIADWVYHDADGNPHAHIMTTLRPLNEDGFGAKKVAVLDNDGNVIRDGDRIRYINWGGSKEDLHHWRALWSETANRHMVLAGVEATIDHRSYIDQGLSLEGTTHLGPAANAIRKRLGKADKDLQFGAVQRRNAEAIESDPSQVLKIVSNEKAVFTDRDIARTLFRFIDDPETFHKIYAEVMALPELRVLVPKIIDPESNIELSQQLFSTEEMITTERAMADRARHMSVRDRYNVDKIHVDFALAEKPFLAEEQKAAVRHITDGSQIAAVIGFAGTGKSTMLDAAREAWERQGYKVYGGALAGKASEELEKSSAIKSRTLASWELAWSHGRGKLKDGDIFVVDEAGMVSSRQLARIVEEVEAKGAKLVLVGDAMQLQPIEAGAAFRALTERIGYVELEGIRRQKEEWSRAASIDFARGRVKDAVGAYAGRNFVQLTKKRDEAYQSIVRDWIRDHKNGSSLILAHRNLDVHALNQSVRSALHERGELGEGAAFRTARGNRQFATGDRILFLENDGELGVKNGMLGTVRQSSGGKIEVDLDIGRNVVIEAQRYPHVDHGYATTIHKSQGTTVDRAYILASSGLDQHLSYVAMSRHRETATLYASRDEFENLAALTRSMSRKGGQESTLDYDWKGQEVSRELKDRIIAEDRNAFLERRGFESERTLAPIIREWIEKQTKRLQELWERLEAALRDTDLVLAAEPVSATIPTAEQPEQLAQPQTDATMFAAVHDHDRSIEETAKQAATEGRLYQSEIKVIRAAFGKVFSDGPAALARIERAIAAGDDPIKLGAIVAAEPARIGALRGSNRKEALAVSKAAGARVRRLADAYGKELRAARERETERRRQMTVAVPRLSPEASAALARVSNFRSNREHYRLAVAGLQDTSEGKEIARFTEALQKRFGPDAFKSKQERPEKYDHLVKEQERVQLHGNRLTLHSARRMQEEQAIIAGLGLSRSHELKR